METPTAYSMPGESTGYMLQETVHGMEELEHVGLRGQPEQGQEWDR